MSNVYLLTFHGSVNYGAVLQAYALNQTVRDMGYSCQTIDYNRELHQRNYLKIQGSSLKGRIYQMLHWPAKRRLQKKFDRFVRSNNCLTEKSYNGFHALNSAGFSPDDTYIVGSDQIWNCQLTENNFHYYLDFVDSPNKYSYAASFGVSDISSWDQKEQALKLLSQFRRISVREESGQKIVKQNLGLDAQVVCDPTFLLERSAWAKIAETPSESKYVLLFMLHRNETLIEKAKTYARDRGLELINIDYSTGKLPGMKNVSGIGPEQWLGYIQNAQQVFTNSFHGFALSLNFESQVVVALSKIGRNSRIVDLAKRYGVQDHILSDDGNYAQAEIDFHTVSAKIKQDRERSKAFLKDVLNESTK